MIYPLRTDRAVKNFVGIGSPEKEQLVKTMQKASTRAAW